MVKRKNDIADSFISNFNIALTEIATFAGLGCLASACDVPCVDCCFFLWIFPATAMIYSMCVPTGELY